MAGPVDGRDKGDSGDMRIVGGLGSADVPS